MTKQLPIIQPIPPEEFKPRGRIAVIGAGLTGVSSAAHAIAHGFDVVIYEQSDSIPICLISGIIRRMDLPICQHPIWQEFPSYRS